MGFFDTIGRYAQYATVPGLVFGGGAKNAANWLGGKSKGATETNNQIDDVLSGYGVGYGSKIGKIDPKTGIGYNPKPTSGYDNILSSLQDSYNQSRQRSGAAYDKAFSGYSNFADNGGWDAGRIASMDSNIAGMKNIGRFGADSAEGANRIRGNGVFEEFARTGGLSEGDKANLRSRGASTIPAFFASLKNNLSRQNTAQGGFNPGYTSQMSKLARDQAHGATEENRNIENDIIDRVISGRQWGAGSMSAAEKAIVDNMMAGLSGASSTELAMMNAINEGKRFGTAGLAGLYSTPGADLAYGNALLQGQGQKDRNIIDILGLKAGRNPNESNFDRYGPMIMNAIAQGTKMFGA